MKEEKNLAQNMKKDKAKEEIVQYMKSLEKDNDKRTKFYEDCELQLGELPIKVSILQIEEDVQEKDKKDEKEKGNETDKIISYEIYIKTKEGYIMIGEINQDGELILNEENLQRIDPENKLQLEKDKTPDLSEIKSLEEKTEEELSEELENKKENDTKDNNESKDQPSNSSRKEIELDREFTNGENIRMWVKRTMGVDAKRLWREEGKENNDFYYIAETDKGEIKVPINDTREGKNSRQPVWIMNKDGEFEKKAANSLLLNGNGKYGIATDKADDPFGDTTKSMPVVALPNGEYIAVQAPEKQGVNRDTSNNELEKDIIDRTHSVYDIEETVKAAETSKKIDEIQEDGKTDVEEIKLVEYLRKEGFDEYQIEKIFETVLEGYVDKDMTYEQAQDRCEQVEDLRAKGFNNEQITDVLETMQDENKNFEESVETVENGREEDDEYAGYGQQRPH